MSTNEHNHKGYRFTIYGGETFVEGKAHWPAFMRLMLPRDQILTQAMDLLRALEHGQHRQPHDLSAHLEIPLFGELVRVPHDDAHPGEPVAWRDAVLDMIDDAQGLTLEQDAHLTREVKRIADELDVPSEHPDAADLDPTHMAIRAMRDLGLDAFAVTADLNAARPETIQGMAVFTALVERVRNQSLAAAAAREAKLLGQLKSLKKALRFYAEGNHFHRHQPEAWDTVSGEPSNFFEDESNTATVEDGSIAARCLRLADENPTLETSFFNDPILTCPGDSLIGAVQGARAGDTSPGQST
jgi:hypothetical protein